MVAKGYTSHPFRVTHSNEGEKGGGVRREEKRGKEKGKGGGARGGGRVATG